MGVKGRIFVKLQILDDCSDPFILMFCIIEIIHGKCRSSFIEFEKNGVNYTKEIILDGYHV